LMSATLEMCFDDSTQHGICPFAHLPSLLPVGHIMVQGEGGYRTRPWFALSLRVGRWAVKQQADRNNPR
jgi:hypothetical protein